VSVLPAATAEPATLSPEPVILDAGNAHLGENRGVIPPSSVQVWTFQGRNGQLIVINAIADQPTTGIYGITEQIERGALDTWLAVRAPMARCWPRTTIFRETATVTHG